MFPKLIGPQDPFSFFHYTLVSIHQNWYSSKHGLEDPAHSLIKFLWPEWYSTDRELMRFRDGSNPSCCSVSHSCQTLWDPMNCSTSGFPVLHYLWQFAQTHVHGVGDAIQPSYALLPPSPLALSLPQHQGILEVASYNLHAKIISIALLAGDIQVLF